MKWRQAKRSTKVMYQSSVHKVRPKQSVKAARDQQIKDAEQLIRMPVDDQNADKIYNKRKRVRVGDR